MKSKAKDKTKPEYSRKDLGKGVRGKYFAAYAEAHNIVLLDSEVARAFRSEKAVNEALMSLIWLARVSTSLPTESGERS